MNDVGWFYTGVVVVWAIVAVLFMASLAVLP